MSKSQCWENLHSYILGSHSQLGIGVKEVNNLNVIMPKKEIHADRSDKNNVLRPLQKLV